MTDILSLVQYDEEWLPIPSWPLYEASSQGRVRRVGGTRALKARVNNGYLVVTMYRGSRASRKLCAVHRLVAEAFHGPCLEGQEVDHGEDGPADNRPQNLEYVTHVENMRRRKRRGGYAVGEAHHSTPLRENDVVRIRGLAETGRSQRSLAKQFGVSQKAVWAILRRQTWVHV